MRRPMRARARRRAAGCRPRRRTRSRAPSRRRGSTSSGGRGRAARRSRRVPTRTAGGCGSRPWRRRALRCSSVWMCTAGVTSSAPSTTRPSASIVSMSPARTSRHQSPHGFTRMPVTDLDGDVTGEVLAPAVSSRWRSATASSWAGLRSTPGARHGAGRPGGQAARPILVIAVMIAYGRRRSCGRRAGQAGPQLLEDLVEPVRERAPAGPGAPGGERDARRGQGRAHHDARIGVAVGVEPGAACDLDHQLALDRGQAGAVQHGERRVALREAPSHEPRVGLRLEVVAARRAPHDAATRGAARHPGVAQCLDHRRGERRAAPDDRVLLRWEVVEERARRHTRRGRDVLHGDVLEAALVGKPQRRRHQRVARLGLLPLAQPGCVGRSTSSSSPAGGRRRRCRRARLVGHERGVGVGDERVLRELQIGGERAGHTARAVRSGVSRTNHARTKARTRNGTANHEDVRDRVRERRRRGLRLGGEASTRATRG